MKTKIIHLLLLVFVYNIGSALSGFEGLPPVLISFLVSRGWKVVSISGDKAQTARTEALSLFKEGTCPLLVCVFLELSVVHIQSTMSLVVISLFVANNTDQSTKCISCH